MTEQEYVAAVTEGTGQYYKYLKENGKGKDEVRVISVVAYNGMYELTLSGRLYNDGSDVEFCICNISYTTGMLRPVKYDRIRNILTVWATEEFVLDLKDRHGCGLEDIPVDRIVLRSDLLFLVQRVLNWYRRAAAGVCPSPKIDFPPKPICDYVACPWIHPQYFPSPEQAQAIRTAMTSSLSYIWGAPGAGKTKFVLARCLVSHISMGHKVLVCAPTNIALEQTLFGVLSVLRDEQIPSNRILRLGTPSDRFADEYPECCVQRGAQERFNELSIAKEELEAKIAEPKRAREKLLTYRKYSRYTTSALKNVKERQEELIAALEAEKQLDEEIARDTSELEKLNDLLASTEAALREAMTQATSSEKEKHTFHYKISHVFGTAYSSEVERSLAIANVKVDKKIAEKEGIISRFNEVAKRLNEKRTQYNQRAAVNDIVRHFKKTQSKLKKRFPKRLAPLIEELNAGNARERFAKMITTLEETTDEINTYLTEHSENDIPDTAEIERQIERIDTELKGLSPKSVQSRLESVAVVALTADSFVGSYELIRESHANRKFNHIFIDEAGYLCAAKGMTLFSLGIPVTLLGDHMQLPPVCEMNFDQETEPIRFPAVFWSLPIIYCCNIRENELDVLYRQFIKNELTPFEGMPREMLTQTFRFGVGLARALSKHVYKDPYSVISATRNAETEIVVIDAARTNTEREKRENHSEAAAIAAYLDSTEWDSDSVSILTPYNAQRKVLSKYLPKSLKESILTVHKSQGQEWETVILSVVDTHNKWFTTTLVPERGGVQVLNTAISRARRRLVIVCDYKHWLSCPNELLGDIVAHADAVISFE